MYGSPMGSPPFEETPPVAGGDDPFVDAGDRFIPFVFYYIG